MLNLKPIRFALPLWLEQYLARRRYRKVVQEARAVKSYKAHRKLCAQLLDGLDAQLFTKYDPAAGLAVLVTPLYPNVEHYTAKLKEAAALVQQAKILDPNWLTRDEHWLSLDRFLVSTDGYYVVPSKAIDAFRTAGLQLCTALAKSDEEASGVYEHNLRVLTRLFINLRLLTLAMLDAAPQK